MELLDNEPTSANILHVTNQLNNYAAMCITNSDFNAALRVLLRIDILTKSGSQYFLPEQESHRIHQRATMLNNFGCLEQKRGNLKAAFKYLSNAIELGHSSCHVLLNVIAVLDRLQCFEQLEIYARALIAKLERSLLDGQSDSPTLESSEKGKCAYMLVLARYHLARAIERISLTGKPQGQLTHFDEVRWKESSTLWTKALHLAQEYLGLDSEVTQNIEKCRMAFMTKIESMKRLSTSTRASLEREEGSPESRILIESESENSPQEPHTRWRSRSRASSDIPQPDPRAPWGSPTVAPIQLPIPPPISFVETPQVRQTLEPQWPSPRASLSPRISSYTLPPRLEAMMEQKDINPPRLQEAYGNKSLQPSGPGRTPPVFGSPTVNQPTSIKEADHNRHSHQIQTSPNIKIASPLPHRHNISSPQDEQEQASNNKLKSEERDYMRSENPKASQRMEPLKDVKEGEKLHEPNRQSSSRVATSKHRRSSVGPPAFIPENVGIVRKLSSPSKTPHINSSPSPTKFYSPESDSIQLIREMKEIKIISNKKGPQVVTRSHSESPSKGGEPEILELSRDEYGHEKLIRSPVAHEKIDSNLITESGLPPSRWWWNWSPEQAAAVSNAGSVDINGLRAMLDDLYDMEHAGDEFTTYHFDKNNNVWAGDRAKAAKQQEVCEVLERSLHYLSKENELLRTQLSQLRFHTSHVLRLSRDTKVERSNGSLQKEEKSPKSEKAQSKSTETISTQKDDIPEKKEELETKPVMVSEGTSTSPRADQATSTKSPEAESALSSSPITDTPTARSKDRMRDSFGSAKSPMNNKRRQQYQVPMIMVPQWAVPHPGTAIHYGQPVLLNNVAVAFDYEASPTISSKRRNSAPIRNDNKPVTVSKHVTEVKPNNKLKSSPQVAEHSPATPRSTTPKRRVPRTAGQAVAQIAAVAGSSSAFAATIAPANIHGSGPGKPLPLAGPARAVFPPGPPSVPTLTPQENVQKPQTIDDRTVPQPPSLSSPIEHHQDKSKKVKTHRSSSLPGGVPHERMPLQSARSHLPSWLPPPVSATHTHRNRSDSGSRRGRTLGAAAEIIQYDDAKEVTLMDSKVNRPVRRTPGIRSLSRLGTRSCDAHIPRSETPGPLAYEAAHGMAWESLNTRKSSAVTASMRSTGQRNGEWSTFHKTPKSLQHIWE